MNIFGLELSFQAIITLIGGLGISVFLGSKLSNVARDFIKNKKRELINSVNTYIKDPQWQVILYIIMLKVQKDAGGKTGKERLEIARKELLRLVPDMLDNVADKVIQAAFDEGLKPIYLPKDFANRYGDLLTDLTKKT
jgi:hypothetical protein